MKVVALVSGGKDSCYVILKCLSYGHHITALAHVAPPRGSPEPDSHMYQSVGTDVVPALAQALGLPLYTRRTTAQARTTELNYSPQVQDEVEDLYGLLGDVRNAHPDITGVCAGALWSDYQRLRVESAASRHGLVSLAYLWRRDQRELLHEMIANGVCAVLIKVAGIGLSEKHLGRSLKDLEHHLLYLNDRYGSHVCGEGGEYETLVLSLPTFTHDLVMPEDMTEAVLHSDDPVAPVAYLSVKRLDAVEKKAGSIAHQLHGKLPEVPPIPCALRPIPDDVFPVVRASCQSTADQSCGEAILAMSSCRPKRVSFCRVQDYIHVVVQSALTNAEGVVEAVEALRDAIDGLVDKPRDDDNCSDPLGEVLCVWLSLQSLCSADYQSSNKAYSAIFNIPACTPPPVRACVGTTGFSYSVTLEALARIGRRATSSTTTLHVQSISEWAPPCIGPYAQVVSDRAVAHVCGVLPLHAPIAAIPAGLGARAQTRACLHNMRRTLEATHARLDGVRMFVAYVVFRDAAEAVEEEIRSAFVGDAAADGVQRQFSGPVAIVPVQALPKGAIVEIRAVAACVENGEERSVGCCSTARATIHCMEWDVIEIPAMSRHCVVPSLVEACENRAVLSMQLYVLRDERTADIGGYTADVQAQLRDAGIGAAFVAAAVDWLAHSASAMCIITSIVSP